MLRQIYVIKDHTILYERQYGKALSKSEFRDLIPDIIKSGSSGVGNEFKAYDYFKYKISFVMEKELNLIFILITGIVDDSKRILIELRRFKNYFLNLFYDEIGKNINTNAFDILNPIVDGMHRNLKTKISLVGFPAVGKTTIIQLINAKEVPLEHVPTINGEIATIKIGKLIFYLWDFADQEQFSFLWNKFIEGSGAVLLITDSTPKNIEESKFFLDLIAQEVPYAHAAIIGNKQDLTEALKVEDIERIMGVKTYSMIAVDPNNRDKMIQIIADILDMSIKDSPLLKPLFERKRLVDDAHKALENADLSDVAYYYERIAEKCIEIGDERLGREFYEKSRKLKQIL